MAKSKTVIKLIGESGNAFYIIGACRKAAKRDGWGKKQIKELESLRDETQVEIQELEATKNQLEIV